jgi:hypothetical protein
MVSEAAPSGAQRANSGARYAARAIENNNIGAVVLQEKGRVVGIVTDLSDVMTTPVATLTPADSQSDAIRLMQERNVRRIPLVEGERFVGIVTLDDLLLDEAAPLDELAGVVQVQIGEGGPAAPGQITCYGAARRPRRSDLWAPAQSGADGCHFGGR